MAYARDGSRSWRAASRACPTPRPAAHLPASSGLPDLVDIGFRVPRLMLVTDVRRTRMPLLDLVTEAAAGGVDAIYLRDAGGSIDDLELTTRTLRAQIDDAVALLANGGPEAALATGSGLHLRERDIAPATARTVLGPRVLIGRSVHSPEGAVAATGDDYV